jgi:hypothetical protein
LRQGDSRNIRALTLSTEMPKDTTIQAKIATAGQYYSSFEFQLIDDGNCDTDADRDNLYDSAMTEFFMAINPMMPNPNAKIDPTSTKEQDEDLFALAVAAQQVNPNRALLDQQHDLSSVSMLTLIEDSLSQASDVNSGNVKVSDLPLYQQVVLQNQQAAVQLLRVRADFFPGMVLLQITNLQDLNNWGPFNFLRQAFDTIGALIEEKTGAQATFDNLTVAELENVSTWMGFASDQINYLNAQKFSFTLDSNLKEFYKNLKLPAPGKSAEDAKLASAELVTRSSAESDLLTQIHSFRKLVGAE